MLGCTPVWVPWCLACLRVPSTLTVFVPVVVLPVFLQTVEVLFYVSFLVKDSEIVVAIDPRTKLPLIGECRHCCSCLCW